MLLGVDVGGTFTDAALLGDGRLITAKAPTTVPDQSQGVLDAVEAALAEAGRDASDVAITTSFGIASLAGFHVVSDEVTEVEGSAPMVPMSSAG